jgi:hypothetical protein
MKVSTTTIVGVISGLAIGIVGLGRANMVTPDVANISSKIHPYMMWIVLGSLLVPLADYFVSTNLPTTIIGFIARQPFRHVAGFFTGLATGLLALMLLAPQIPQML